MKTLYKWLIEDKHYTEDEATETIIRYNDNMDIPKEVLKDIRDYTYLYINSIERRLINELQDTKITTKFGTEENKNNQCTN